MNIRKYIGNLRVSFENSWQTACLRKPYSVVYMLAIVMWPILLTVALFFIGLRAVSINLDTDVTALGGFLGIAGFILGMAVMIWIWTYLFVKICVTFRVLSPREAHDFFYTSSFPERWLDAEKVKIYEETGEVEKRSKKAEIIIFAIGIVITMFVNKLFDLL